MFDFELLSDRVQVVHRKCERLKSRIGVTIFARVIYLIRGVEWLQYQTNLAMSLVIPEGILTTTPMSEAEMRQEIAIMLFQKETDPCSSQPLCRNRPHCFSTFTCKSHIPVYYDVEDFDDVEDFEQDIRNLSEMDRL